MVKRDKPIMMKERLAKKIFLKFVTGELSSREFWEMYKQDESLRNVLVYDKRKNKVMKSKWGDGNYLFYRPEAMEPLKREELISKINIDLLQDRCYLFTAVKHFLEERGIRIKPSDYNEDMKESLFLEEMLPEWVEVYDIGFLQNIFASAPAGTKQEKLEWCKQEVLRLFRYETKPPEWWQGADWPIVNGKPLVFRRQEEAEEGFERYYFYDPDSGEEKIIEQVE